jgi:hypothetical protein
MHNIIPMLDQQFPQGVPAELTFVSLRQVMVVQTVYIVDYAQFEPKPSVKGLGIGYGNEDFASGF